MPEASAASESRRLGFTLVELMAAVAVLSVILLLVFSITQSTGSAWKSARSRIEAFQGSRAAFENIGYFLSQATLNTYYGYFDAQGRSRRDAGYGAVHHYGRQSELHFICGNALVPGQVTNAVFFQTPAGYTSDLKYQGMTGLLNACGYYVTYGKDTLRPDFLDDLPNAPSNEDRYRLMQFYQPSQELAVYSSAVGLDWFRKPIESRNPPVRQLAENVIAIGFVPRAPDSANKPVVSGFEYDSRKRGTGAVQEPWENQLPPLIDLVQVALDEASARRLKEQGLQLPKVFEQGSDFLERDLATLEEYLVELRLTYRMFRTTVALHNSKWTP